MRKSYQTSQQRLGQFMTPDSIATLLASQLRAGGATLLELGAGEGALISAVRDRFSGLRTLAVERDAILAQALRTVSDKVIVGDARSRRVQDAISKHAPFDYAIGNPPFAVASSRRGKTDDVLSWGLHDPVRGPRLDAAFVAQSLQALRPTGSAAFILPLAFFTDECFRTFRALLVQRFANIRVLQLPVDVFGSAEVSTALCSFHGAKTRRSRIEVGLANSDGRVLDLMQVPPSEAIYRLDHEFHKDIATLRKWVAADAPTLSSLGVQVVRGSATAKQMQQCGRTFLHTSDLPASGVGRFRYGQEQEDGFKLARAGDIVVPRVGTRCMMRQAVIMRGQVAFTEGLYRLRAAPAVRAQVLTSLAGPVGEIWRRLHAKGSCAKHLTVSALLQMPVAY
ncbi:MAG: hypothetical protein C0439_19860 [Pseudomonas sp.]|nr:hypothetical protein [Pseudomonas sp.]